MKMPTRRTATRMDKAFMDNSIPRLACVEQVVFPGQSPRFRWRGSLWYYTERDGTHSRNPDGEEIASSFILGCRAES